MVVGERQRQHQPWGKLLTTPHRLDGGFGDTENGHLRGIDDGRKGSTTYGAKAGDGEDTALHLIRLQFLLPRFSSQLNALCGQLPQTLAINIFNHRYQQAVGRIHRHTDMDVLFVDQRLTVRTERGAKLRHQFQHVGNGLEDKRYGCKLCISGLGRQFLRLAKRFQFGDIALIKLRYPGHIEPGTLEVLCRDFTHPTQGDFFYVAPLTEVNLGYGRNASASGLGGFIAEAFFHIPLHILLENAVTRTAASDDGQINTKLPGQLTHCRPCMVVTVAALKLHGIGFGVGRWFGRCPGSLLRRCCWRHRNGNATADLHGQNQVSLT